jgi:RNA polymerase sigma-70 factor (ECF subfamily)
MERCCKVQSDLELVQDTLAGRPEAFETLVERYEPSVRAAALNIVKDRHLASDVAQESFVRAYRRLGALRRPAAFGGWLLRITQRCALDMATRRPREVPLEEQVHEPVVSHNGHLAEDKQRLLAAVLQLPVAEQQVVMLRYFGSHTVREVAKMAGRSVGTVTKQLSRAHRRLRNILEEP